MDISVVVPTRNRAKLLKRCLASLCEQSYAPALYEICAVDNGSTDDTKEIVREVSVLFPQHNLYVVEEPETGVARARNRGLKSTQSALVAFIDDDAVASRDWLQRYVTTFSMLGEKVGVAGGGLVPEWLGEKPAWLTPRMMGALSALAEVGDKACFVRPPQNLLEGNTCYRRDAIESVGGFPAELGRVGDNLLSGEGCVNMVIHSRGRPLYYDPSITITHSIRAERLNPGWFRRRSFWQGVSGYLTHLYYQRQGVPVLNSLRLALPLDARDWEFVTHNNAGCTDESLNRFEGLGFALAMAEILRVKERAQDNTSNGSRRDWFWRGVTDFASEGDNGRHEEFLQKLPLEAHEWFFLNNASIPTDENSYSKFHALGFILAGAGFVGLSDK